MFVKIKPTSITFWQFFFCPLFYSIYRLDVGLFFYPTEISHKDPTERYTQRERGEHKTGIYILCYVTIIFRCRVLQLVVPHHISPTINIIYLYVNIFHFSGAIKKKENKNHKRKTNKTLHK